MLVFGFEDLGLQRVVAWCRVDNPGSIRVLEKIGMRREGRSNNSDAVPERWRNHYRFGLSVAEWSLERSLGRQLRASEPIEFVERLRFDS